MAEKIFTEQEVVDKLKQLQGTRKQNEFAELIGIVPSQLCEVYKGVRRPSEEILAHLDMEFAGRVYRKKVK